MERMEMKFPLKIVLQIVNSKVFTFCLTGSVPFLFQGEDFCMGKRQNVTKLRTSMIWVKQFQKEKLQI